MNRLTVGSVLVLIFAYALHIDAAVYRRPAVKKAAVAKKAKGRQLGKKAAVKKVNAGKQRGKKRSVITRPVIRKQKPSNSKRRGARPAVRGRPVAPAAAGVLVAPVAVPVISAAPVLTAAATTAASATHVPLRRRASDGVAREIPSPVEESNFFETFASWKKAVDVLPKGTDTTAFYNRHFTRYEGVAKVRGLTEKVFNTALNEYCVNAQRGPLGNAAAWFDGTAPDASFYDLAATAVRPIYVQKETLPVGSRLIIHGDLHGAVHGMVAAVAEYVDVDHGFRLKDANTYLLFLGDYVDRGLYGYECIYTLLRLKNANPGRVFLVRGNHESPDVCKRYGFDTELDCKGVCGASKNSIFNWYDLLPAALFVICQNRAAQLCHGGIEPSYSPKLFLSAAAAPVQFQRLPELTHQNGFMWTDFQVDAHAPTENDPLRGRIYGSVDTHNYFARASTSGGVILCTIIRAHQHSGEMMDRILGRDGMNEDNHGAAKLWTDNKRTGNLVWQGAVITLNVAQDTPYGGSSFNYDTYAILTLGERFRDWTLQITRKEVAVRT